MVRVPRHTLFEDYQQDHRPPRLHPNIFARLARFAFHNAAFVMAMWLIGIIAASIVAWHFLAEAPQRNLVMTKGSRPAEYMALLNQNFPNLEALTTITLSNDDPEQLKLVRASVVTQMEAQNDKFDLVFAPGTGDYYDAHAILYHSKDEIEARVAYALSLRPLFSAIAQAPTTESLATLVGEVSSVIREGRDPQGLDDLFQQCAKSLQALMQGSNQPVDWTRIAGLNVDAAPNVAVILALPKEGMSEPALTFAKELLVTIGKQSATLATLEQAHASAAVTEFTFPSNTRAIQAMAITAFLLAFIFLSVLGRLNLFLMTLLPLAAALATAAVVVALLLPNVALALWPVFIGIALTSVIVSVRASFAAIEAQSDIHGAAAAVMMAAQKQGAGLVWQSAIGLVAWLGFLSLWGTPMVMVVAIAAASIAVALLATFTLVPTLAHLSGTQLDWRAALWVMPLYNIVFGSTLWHLLSRILPVAMIALACASLYFAPQLLKNQPRATGVDQPVNIIATDMVQAQTLVQKLKSVPEAKSVRWLGAFLPQDVEAKQQLLGGLKDQFPRIGSLSNQTPDELRDQITTLQTSLSDIAGQKNVRPELRDAADELRRSLELLSGTSANTEIVEVENRLFGTFNGLAKRADQLAEIDKPDIDALDARLKTLFLSPNNVYRLAVSPVQGQSQSALAVILYNKGFPVAHPWLVAQQQDITTKNQYAMVLGTAGLLGLVLLSMALGEAAGISSSFITSAVAVVLLAGAMGYLNVHLGPQLLLIVCALLGAVLNLIASVFLKVQISDHGMPAAAHGVEAWLPAVVISCFALPIFLLQLQTLQLPAAIMLASLVAFTIAIAFLLRPITLYFRGTYRD